ncbi:hypothetical protein H7B90_06740 [Cohnella xylanilytica]|uniref:Uncharacterized protein n=1 Tax=Cohnella xylanilytica TaxID=557555 RepID=A0A841TRR6_9BACL|nr:hypothetical protein [Cohnella xylanilytica]MBB6691097.1 hypothetical protein [Cohnella xylanilytica]
MTFSRGRPTGTHGVGPAAAAWWLQATSLAEKKSEEREPIEARRPTDSTNSSIH